jgi:hypothetical protein
MEQRERQRTLILKGGKLMFNQQDSLVDCTVRNLTNRGACLLVQTTIGVPREFDLSFDSFRTVRRCYVKWRTESRLGIAFHP